MHTRTMSIRTENKCTRSGAQSQIEHFIVFQRQDHTCDGLVINETLQALIAWLRFPNQNQKNCDLTQNCHARRHRAVTRATQSDIERHRASFIVRSRHFLTMPDACAARSSRARLLALSKKPMKLRRCAPCEFTAVLGTSALFDTVCLVLLYFISLQDLTLFDDTCTHFRWVGYCLFLEIV